MPPRAASQPVPLPIWFLMLGMLVGVVALCTGFALSLDRVGTLGRAVLAAVAILSVCLIEALWWTRPWVGRTVDAWAAVCTLAMVASISGVAGGPGFGLALSFAVCFVALPCAGVRWYVRDRAKRLGLTP
jgi:hypothetical protein